MGNHVHTVDEFVEPEAENLFLASRKGLHTYADLMQFQLFFLQLLIDFEHDFSKPLGFLANTSDELIFAIASCWNLGIPFVFFNTRMTETEINTQLNTLDTGLVICDQSHIQKVPAEQSIHLKQLSLKRALSVDTKLGYKANSHKAQTDKNDIFGYFFTSGTTGNPKIVPLKRRQMYAAAKASANNFKSRVGHFWLLCLPLYHIGGISIILRSLLYGSGIYRMNKFNPDTVSTFLSENKLFQAASLVPTMLKRLLEFPMFRTHKNFKAILLGGGPVNAGLLEQARQRGVPVVSSYGMTETCGQIAANALLKPSGLYCPLKSVGAIFEPNDIQIRDKQNKKLGINNSGSIWIKGPQVFDGYLSPPSPNLVFDESGWFNTGDYGHINANGHLFMESRRTDLIITGGENVSPFEVESELKKIDLISEAAVLGLEHKEWGQQVVAVVVAKTKEQLQPEDIQNKLKKRVTSYKIPKRIIQAETIPRTQTGKVKRTELTKLFR